MRVSEGCVCLFGGLISFRGQTRAHQEHGATFKSDYSFFFLKKEAPPGLPTHLLTFA